MCFVSCWNNAIWKMLFYLKNEMIDELNAVWGVLEVRQRWVAGGRAGGIYWPNKQAIKSCSFNGPNKGSS